MAAKNDKRALEAAKAVTDPKQILHPDCEHHHREHGTIATTHESIKDAEEKDAKGFLFDIIVVRLDILSKTVQDPSKISIGVHFYNKNVTLTSSRINVLDFKPEPILEFYAKPLTLKDELSITPLRLKVTEEDKVLGYGKFDWPEEFLNALIDCAGEMKHSAETELRECDGTKTGTIQIILSLQPKCEEYVEDTSPDGNCRNANKEINPTDVLFVVGEDKNPCCCSQVGIIPASESDEDLRPKCLDLSNFRALNSQNVNDIDVFNSIDPACQKIKSFQNHYEKLMNAAKSKENTCNTEPKNSGLNCFLFQSSSDSLHMPLNCDSDSKAFTTKNIRIASRMTPPNLIENEPESLRYCPLCKENMTFLPKLAACPNCCYKPVPHFEEKSYNDDQNAEQIIKEYQNDIQSDDDADSNTDFSKCRCTCQCGSNKLCAHCRIRKLCENIFKPPSSNVTKPTCVSETKSSETHCPSTDSRPFLSKIFSELKDLYDIEEPKKKKIETDERCEKELNKSPIKKMDKKQPKLNDYTIKCPNNNKDQKQCISPRKRFKHKRRCLRPVADKAVKSKVYDYETVRQHPPLNMGHKTCVNGFAGRKNVPPHMGWLWNVHRSGKWKPGAIRKPIKELMRYFLKDFPADTLLVSKYSYRNSAKINNFNSIQLVQKPTLHIQKSNGEYIITMRPLKSSKLLKDAADPYEDMKPIQFRIVKNPKLDEIRKIKQFLKDMGFKKCTCHKPIIYCYCRSFLDKKKLEYQCNKECRKRQLPPCCNTLVLSDTSESEEEFDFGVTPPAGIIKPERLKKINLVNVSTQYNEIDWNPQPLFPRPPNKYMQMYQCAVGDRKAKRLQNNIEGVSGSAMARGVCVPGARGTGYAAGSKMMGYGVSSGIGARAGGGDGLFSRKRGDEAIGGKSTGFKGKYGGRSASASTSKNKLAKNVTPEGKVDMMKYLQRASKKKPKLTPAEVAAKRREKMKLLKGVNPPLLCMVDRLGKPINPCDPCFPCNDNRIC